MSKTNTKNVNDLNVDFLEWNKDGRYFQIIFNWNLSSNNNTLWYLRLNTNIHSIHVHNDSWKPIKLRKTFMEILVILWKETA